MPHTKPIYGGWEKQKVLGNGGFGTVMLFKHEDTGEYIALKKCRMAEMMSPKHRERWQMEINIMLRLDHPSIIHALPVPHPLEALEENDIPMLAMEYCSEGDLRSVLNKPENCCGMKEGQVRAIAKDVGAGIEYLNQQRIIHRDIKPENIVLQKVDEKIVYKLIDLGYAKDMEEGSICHSFVGTMQYLAPEFFTTRKYSAKVDYWSFGTLLFECITGFRPFLHGHPPAQWMLEIIKGPQAIYAYLNERGDISRSNSLPQPNQLCQPSAHVFEELLRMLLRWLPQDRGGVFVSSDKRYKCFMLMDKIIATKILYVLCVRSNQLMPIPIENPSRPLSSIQADIEKASGIPVEQQEFLLATGIKASLKDPMAVYWTDEDREADSCHLFLFRQDETAIEPLETWQKGQTPLPTLVASMLQDQATLMMYQEQRKVWGHVVYFVQQMYQEYERLLNAETAARMDLMRIKERVTKKLRFKSEGLEAEVTKLLAKIDFFVDSVKYDLQKYADQITTGITSKKMMTRWEKQKQKVQENKDLEKKVSNMVELCNTVTGRVKELERSPYSSASSSDRQDSELARIQEEVMKLYSRLRSLPHEQRNKGQSNREMAVAVVNCRETQKRLTGTLHAHLSAISKCKGDLQKLEPQIEDLINQIKKADSELMEEQKLRQKDMWYLVSVALTISSSRTPQQQQQDVAPMSLMDLQSMASSTTTFHRAAPASSAGSTTGDAAPQSASFIDSALDISLRTISDNNQLRDRLKLPTMVEENFGDWSFLGMPVVSPVRAQNPPLQQHLPPPAAHSVPAQAEALHHGMPARLPLTTPTPAPSPHTYVNVQGRNLPPHYITRTPVPSAAAAAAAASYTYTTAHPSAPSSPPEQYLAPNNAPLRMADYVPPKSAATYGTSATSYSGMPPPAPHSVSGLHPPSSHGIAVGPPSSHGSSALGPPSSYGSQALGPPTSYAPQAVRPPSSHTSASARASPRVNYENVDVADMQNRFSQLDLQGPQEGQYIHPPGSALYRS